MVGDKDVRVRDAAGFQADRDVWISVEVVHYVCNVCVGAVHAVHYDADQVTAFHIHIPVKHHKGKEVVCRGAEICVQDDAEVFLLVVGPEVDALGGNIDRVLAVVSCKLYCCGKAVFREDAVGVEVVLAILGVEPAAYKAVMFSGVLDNIGDAFAVEAVLGGGIGHHDAFCWLAHGVDIQGEAVGIHLAHCPDCVVEFLVCEVGISWLGNCGYCRGDRDCENCSESQKEFFHICAVLILMQCRFLYSCPYLKFTIYTGNLKMLIEN